MPLPTAPMFEKACLDLATGDPHLLMPDDPSIGGRLVCKEYPPEDTLGEKGVILKPDPWKSAPICRAWVVETAQSSAQADRQRFFPGDTVVLSQAAIAGSFRLDELGKGLFVVDARDVLILYPASLKET